VTPIATTGIPRAKARLSKGISGLVADTREYFRLSKLNGGLVPLSMVANILGVSRQRVHQLVDEGTFSHWTFYGMKWLSQEEVISFAKLNRRAGENQYNPSVKQMWKDSREAGQTFIKNRTGRGS